MVFDDVTVFGGDEHQVERVKRDVQKCVLIRLGIGVLLGWRDQLGEGEIDVLYLTTFYMLKLTGNNCLPILVADSY